MTALRDRLRAITPAVCVELFVVANLAFLGLDIRIAHAMNAFAVRAEWAPVYFSAGATLALAPGAFSRNVRERTRWLTLLVGALSIAVGVAGMLFHLESGFFEGRTMRNLVYSAPFAAPLAYVGVGLLAILGRVERPGSREWSAWVILLAAGGFVGNFVLSLTDHAENAFFDPLEWVAVGAAAFGLAFLLVAVARPRDRTFLRVCFGVLALEALVGVAGCALHLRADFEGGTAPLWDRFVYGAPAFAPLLFSNLALLGALGLWALMRVAPAPDVTD